MRQQLDADHYGLEKIKKRLIEYLAVVRLKALQAEQEVAEHAAKPSDANTDAAQPASAIPPRRNSVKGPILLYVFTLFDFPVVSKPKYTGLLVHPVLARRLSGNPWLVPSGDHSSESH